MEYGNLVYAQKCKRYCGKSQITNKALYRWLYCFYFYKDGDKQLGLIANKPYTTEKQFKTKPEMKKFLIETGLDINTIEWSGLYEVK